MAGGNAFDRDVRRMRAATPWEKMMQVLLTPDTCFEDLDEWRYQPHYTMITDADGTVLRMAYVDEGSPDAPPVLLLHGEPSWSYLYRRIIAGLTRRGHRVLAPDLIGFGRSDKPAAREDYTYERHVAWLQAWFDAAGTGWSEGFAAWLKFSQEVSMLPVGRILDGGTTRALSAAEVAAYDAPFPDESFKAGARQFPALVPLTPEHASVAENIAAWAQLERFDKPFITAFSDNDPVTRGGERIMQERIPGTRGQPHVTLHGGHFLQEDSPEEIVTIIDALVRATH